MEYTYELAEWHGSLSELQQDAVISRVEVLETAGPGLGRSFVDNVYHSRHSNMKELCCERAIRVAFAFDPRRTAILLIGGDKSLWVPETPSCLAMRRFLVVDESVAAG
ncbi:MAG: diaminopimelate decarboxylase [Actinomycetia bacterium]|nr:diaminopimelate decarboxylase [Actinomycetes bacterium]